MNASKPLGADRVGGDERVHVAEHLLADCARSRRAAATASRSACPPRTASSAGSGCPPRRSRGRAANPWCRRCRRRGRPCPSAPTSLPSRNTGVTTAMSNRWPAHSQGSLVTSTSPGFSVSAGYFASSAFTARGSVRLNTGMARGECASVSPSLSSSSQAKSCASEMTSENAVRQTVSHISSTTLTRRLHMISSADRVGLDAPACLAAVHAGGDDGVDLARRAGRRCAG